MLEFVKTNSENSDFRALIGLLDVELNIRYNRPLDFLNPTNAIPYCNTVLLVKRDDVFVGCGCFKAYEKDTVELKRVFVIKEARKNGIALELVRNLEGWASDLGFFRLILETGVNQPEAIALYKKLNYNKIENFPPYIGNELSVCLGKSLR